MTLGACGSTHEAGGEGPTGSSSQAAPASSQGVPGDTSDFQPYEGIRANETVQFTGTEPFWGGRVTGNNLTYSTPENPDGEPVTVERFAGRGGVSWSGSLQGQPFRMAVTEGQCSDGMSDRVYPFTVTLEVSGEQRQGCAWTDRRSFTPPSGGT
ncbi:COG3650 family protein [Tsuneonella deserti]|uniref:COG3650 family protein n=1 Tax=Tsuneonella deserti TaxID=2035528 RepID=UPI001E5CA694|nr:hypothetical protein [Tsuneonella deserti]